MPEILESDNRSIRLLQPDETTRQISGDVTVNSVFGTDSSETLLTGLEGQESENLTGVATGGRLAREFDAYSNDPKTALAEWVVLLESFVNGQQGEGYTLTSDERDRTISGVVQTVGWERSRAAEFEVGWDIEFVRGNGVMSQNSLDPTDVSPSEGATLDEYDLGDVNSVRVTKQQPFDVFTRAFADPGENDVTASAGATRTITIQGRIEGESYRNDFDNHIRSLVGGDTIVTYESAFPGREVSVMVRDFTGTRTAGVTRLGDYSIEMVEGTTDFSGEF